MNSIDTEHLEAIRQEHEPFLCELESLAVQALASGNWSHVRNHIARQTVTSKIAADEMATPSSDRSETTAQNESKGLTTL